MFDWFKRLRSGARKLTLPAREERAARNTDAIDLKPYTPEPKVFLGQLAYLQLSQFEILTNELKFSPYVTDAVVIGDKRAYLSVLIMIDLDNVEKFAQDHDVPFSNYASLTRAAEVQSLIQTEIDKVNTKFARVEQIKQFRLLDTQLTAEDDELTPTMKLKRKFVENKYKDLIDSMYSSSTH